MAEPLDYLDALARHLHTLALLTYDPSGTVGDCFIEAMPPAPDEAVCLSLYGAGALDARNGWDVRQLQVRVRGTPDPRVSRRRCEAIYSALHGLAGVQLPGGIWLVLAAATAAPASMGVDEAGRHEHVVNLRLDIEAPTDHRTPLRREEVSAWADPLTPEAGSSKSSTSRPPSSSGCRSRT